MKFDDLIDHLHKARIDMKTRTKWRAYSRSPELRLAKCFGYDTSGPGPARVIESEKIVVIKILEALAGGMSPTRVKHEITDPQNLRNRSGRLFTVSEIARLPRPVFAGRIKGALGWQRMSYFEPFVKMEVVRAAQKTVRTAFEGLEFPFFDLDQGAAMQSDGV